MKFKKSYCLPTLYIFGRLQETQLLYLAYDKFLFGFKTDFTVFIDPLSLQNISGTRDSDAHILVESLQRKKHSLEAESGKIAATNCLMVFIVLTQIKSFHFN